MTVAFLILSILLAITATVLSFVFIVPDKRKLPGFFRFCRDLFNFRYLIIEKILQALYIFSTVFIIVFGFFMLFSFHTEIKQIGGSYWGSASFSEKIVWDGWVGFIFMILGPILLRIVFEFSMMTILLIKNVIQINNKLKNQNEGAAEANDMFGVPSYSKAKKAAPAASAAPKVSFCPNCGTRLDENGKCPLCD